MGQPAGRGDTSQPNVGKWYCRFDLGPAVGRDREMTARGMLCTMAGFWYSLSSVNYMDPLLFCSSRGIRWTFFFVLCLQWSEQGGRKRKVQYSALCPGGGRSSASCKNVSTRYQGRDLRRGGCVLHSSRKAQSHLCHAFQSVLISTRNGVSRINCIVTLNTNSVFKRIN